MENIFTEVKNRLSIKDVIEHYSTALFNKDNKCHCPFPDHQDVKSPSLSILKDNNTFRCFGCDKCGSVVDFVMMYKGVDKIQAVRMLNEDFNLGLNFKNQNKRKFDIKKYDKVKNAVTIPYNDKMNYGQLRYVNEKRFWKPPTSDVGTEPIYNKNAINDKDDEPIFIVESPICAMSIEQYNSKAIAICGGGGVSKLDKALKGKKTGNLGFILALDNDKPGARYTDELVAYFKSKRIKYAVCNISGKEKDPNDLLKKSSEALVKNIFKARKEYFSKCTSYRDLKSAQEITSMTLKPVNWLIQDLFPTGLSIICGASKIGKSWFVQNLCLSISNGDKFLDKPALRNACWYMALEDDESLSQARLKMMLKGKPAPNHFFISYEIYPMDKIDKDRPTLMEYIAENIKRNPEIKCVVVDTFQKVRSASAYGESMYAHDYRDISTLKKFADELQIAIILIHHTNKMKDRDTDGDPFAKFVELMG